MMALAALTYHVIDPERREFCAGSYHLPGSSHLYREGKGGKHGYIGLVDAIAKSCDVYFYQLAGQIGVDHIDAFASKFGIGSLTGIDISGEKPGLLPGPEWKRKTFKRPGDQVWFPGETVNFGVGQGYLLVTPLQLAHYTAMLAGHGRNFRPRLVVGVREVGGLLQRSAPVELPAADGISDADWETVYKGMVGATTYGTAASIGKGAPYAIAGKTGTAQVYSVAQNAKYNAKTVAERLRDHAWFIAFAPADKPRIALCVLVENGGFGASAAAPIARRVMDAFLLGAPPAPVADAPVPAGSADDAPPDDPSPADTAPADARGTP
jgi:penicillin-binding protein 2